MGDARAYDYVCALRAMTSTDGMTAEAFAFSHAFLANCATRIVNEVKGINWVCPRHVRALSSAPSSLIIFEQVRNS